MRHWAERTGSMSDEDAAMLASFEDRALAATLGAGAVANTAPILRRPIADQRIAEDGAWSFAFAANAFVDRESAALAYTARLAGGAQLPAWLTFDPVMRLFTGTPPKDWSGQVDILVEASDGALRVSDIFALVVGPVDDRPVLLSPLIDRVAVAGETWRWALPAGSIVDVDSPLTYSIRSTSSTALPAWLTVDPATGTLTGTPPADFTGRIAIVVTGTDGRRSASDTFMLEVVASDAAPVVARALRDQAINEDTAWSYAPQGAFTDPERHKLTYDARLASGAPLPSWISVDRLTGAMTGTPPADFHGTLSIALIASDGARSTGETFDLVVRPVNDAPIVSGTLSSQAGAEDQPWRLVLDAGLFTDPDGDALKLSARLAGGTRLPAWLSFDAATGAFAGTPPADWNGDLAIVVGASDGKLRTEHSFTLTIDGINDSVQLARPIADHIVSASERFSFTLPGGTFVDRDGTAPVLTATLAEGGALPRWLRFDAATGTFSGVAPDALNRPIAVTVTASDGLSASSDTFVLGSGAPVIAAPVEDMRLRGGTTRAFSVAEAFSDPNGDKLSYSARLADGGALPEWLQFNARNGTFTASVPADFAALDVRVTARDATGSASDVFHIAAGPEYLLHATGSNMEASEYRFVWDDFWFEHSGTVSTSLGSFGFDAGPVSLDMWADVGIDYEIGAGLLFEFGMGASEVDVNFSFDTDHEVSRVTDVLNGQPWISTMGSNPAGSMTSVGGTADFHGEVGVEGAVRAFGEVGMSAGIDLFFWSDSAGFSLPFSIDLFDTKTMKSALPGGNGYMFEIDSRDIGSLDLSGTIGESLEGYLRATAPGAIAASGSAITRNVGNGLGTLHSSGRTLFLEAGVDIVGTVANLVEEAVGPVAAALIFGIDLSLSELVQYTSGGKLPAQLSFFGAEAGVDFGLTARTMGLTLGGELYLAERYAFTPDVTVTASTSFDGSRTGALGEKLSFDARKLGEGEGTFRVKLTYHSDAVLTTTYGLEGSFAASYELFRVGAYGSMMVDLWGFGFDESVDFGEWSAVNERIAYDSGLFVPLASVSRRFSFADTVEYVDVAYENFRTVDGSGDSFTLTTNQPSAVGNDRVNRLEGNAIVNIIEGRGGDDTLLGNGGDDTLYGEDGNDTLFGGDGLDRMYGGAGDDTLDSGAGGGALWGEAGNDTLVAGANGAGLYGGAGDDVLEGSAAADDMSGDARIDAGGKDIAHGRGGNDVIFGAGGDDVLDGGDGDDTLDGGGGIDVLIAGEGRDDVTGGYGDDTIDGGAGDDVIRGGYGHDRIAGGAGDDTLYGDGDLSDDDFFDETQDHGDTFVIRPDSGRETLADFNARVGSDGNTIFEDVIDLTAFTDIRSYAALEKAVVYDEVNRRYHLEIRLSVSQTLLIPMLIPEYMPVNADSFRFFGTGPDTLTGTDGNDVLDGGADADTMTGGKGDDLYRVDNPGDWVIEAVGEGADSVEASASWTLPAGVSVERIRALDVGNGGLTLAGNEFNQDIRGGGFDDTLRGGGGDDWLFGNAGADRLEGGDGNDLLVGGKGETDLEPSWEGNLLAGDVLDGGAGIDTVVYDHGVVLDLADNGPGTRESESRGDAFISIEQFFFSAENDTVKGDAGNNVFVGGDGTNFLYGRGGDDYLEGGAGIDWLYGGPGNDRMTGGAGRDLFRFESGEFFPAEQQEDGADSIVDFVSGTDLIVLSSFDARSDLTGDQRLVYSSAETTGAGQWGLQGDGTHLYIVVNTDFDPQYELVIRLENTQIITFNDISI